MGCQRGTIIHWQQGLSVVVERKWPLLAEQTKRSGWRRHASIMNVNNLFDGVNALQVMCSVTVAAPVYVAVLGANILPL